MKYDQESAKIYSELGLTGTYGFFMPIAVEMLQPLADKHVLDFGCGAGRSSHMLALAGASSVVGVDCDEQMLQQAKKIQHSDIVFQQIDNEKKLPAQHFDAAFCANVIPEIADIENLRAMFINIRQSLKSKSMAVFTATNPQALGNEFASFRLHKPASLEPGANTLCEVVNNGDQIKIEDHYWPEETLKDELETAGFVIESWQAPLAKGAGWKSETEIAPELLIKVMAA